MRIAAIVLALFIYSTSGLSQVVLSPEIGLIYAPFSINYSGADKKGGDLFDSKKPNLTIGLSAQMPIHERWYVDVGFAFSTRETAKWSICGSLPACTDLKYTQHFLNVRAHLKYRLQHWIHVGAGVGMWRSINSKVSVNKEGAPQDYDEYVKDYNYFGITTGLRFVVLPRMHFNLDYTYLPGNGKQLYTHLSYIHFKSIVSATLSIPIGSKE